MNKLKKLYNQLFYGTPEGERYSGHFHVSLHWIDLINIWKTDGINYLFDLKGTPGLRGYFIRHLFFSYWTPAWHEGRGPYISIQIGKLRFMRGY